MSVERAKSLLLPLKVFLRNFYYHQHNDYADDGASHRSKRHNITRNKHHHERTAQKYELPHEYRYVVVQNLTYRVNVVGDSRQNVAVRGIVKIFQRQTIYLFVDFSAQLLRDALGYVCKNKVLYAVRQKTDYVQTQQNYAYPAYRRHIHIPRSCAATDKVCDLLQPRRSRNDCSHADNSKYRRNNQGGNVIFGKFKQLLYRRFKVFWFFYHSHAAAHRTSGHMRLFWLRVGDGLYVFSVIRHLSIPPPTTATRLFDGTLRKF